MLRRIIQNAIGRDRTLITDWPAGTSAEDAINQMLADIRGNPSWNDVSQFPQICQAMREHALTAPTPTPSESALMQLFLQRLPDRDRHLLQLFNEGRRHVEIARLMSTDVEAVRQSLAHIYANLRMWMTPRPSPGDGALGAPVLADQNLKRIA